MTKEKLMLAMMAGLSLVALAVIAAETVQVGNMRVTCPNSCVVTNNGDNTVSVVDSAGGRLSIQFVSMDDAIDP